VHGDELTSWVFIYIYSIALPAAPLGAVSDITRVIPRAALALVRTIPLGLVILLTSSLTMSFLKLPELGTSCIVREVLSSFSKLNTQHASREPFRSFLSASVFYIASRGLEDADWLKLPACCLVSAS